MKTLLENTSENLIQKLKTHKNILIITHINPDGDALGASLGLYNFLKQKRNDVFILTPNEHPKYLQFLPGNNDIINFETQNTQAVKALELSELIFAVDFNELSRVGKNLSELIKQSEAYKVIIDHHPYPEYESFNTIISDIKVSSAAELVYQVLKTLKDEGKIVKSVAESIFTGILTDTGCFSYNSSTPQTYQIVAELLQYNVDKNAIYSLVYNNFSEQRTRLMGYCLNQKMKILNQYNTAIIALSLKEKEKFDYQIGDSEGFVNLPFSIQGIKMSVFFMENDNEVKISFRSKDDFPVNEIAQKYFSGGGHKNAAGGRSQKSLNDTIKNFMTILPQYKKQLT